METINDGRFKEGHIPINGFINGHKRNVTHGMRSTPEYNIWCAMKNRCYNKKTKDYKNYGGRGIKVHPHFLGEKGFENFYKEIGRRPLKTLTLERIKNDENYEPGNIKWASRLEQILNRRLNKNKTSNFRGVHKKKNKWIAKFNGTQLGSFKNEHEAAEAYLEKYYNHYKKFPPEYKLIKVNGVFK